MLHSVRLGQRSLVLQFPDRRMVRGELANGAIPNEIEPRISHMAQGDTVFMRHYQGEDASHTPAFFPVLRQTVDFVICHGDGPPYAFGDVALVSAQFSRNDLDGG